MRIGRHDALGADERVVLQVPTHPVDSTFDHLDRELSPDDAGGADEYAARVCPKLCCRCRRHSSRVFNAALSRRNFAEFAVRDDRSQLPALNRLTTENDRCAREMVSREQCCGRRIHIADE